MNINNLIKSILSLPQKFQAFGDVSIFSLLKKTGYFEIYSQISEDDIYDELNKCPEIINEWFKWSDNKRIVSGWYIKRHQNGKYIVGYFPVGEKLRQWEFNDSKKACAFFIKKEIEEIRKSE